MAFDVTGRNIDYVKKESKTALRTLQDELLESKTNLLRLRLFELLFMERCAIY
jgi:hypothetical protein